MDTLKYYQQRPLRAYMDLTESRLTHVMGEYENAKKMLEDYEGEVKASPEKEALWFYLQIHTMMLVGKAVDNDEPLRDHKHFVDVYHSDINRKMIRMFYYLLLICTRESRHMMTGPGKEKLWKKYPDIYNFHSNHVQDQSSDAAVKAVMDNAPDITLGEYTQFLVDSFQFPSYDSGFGGKKWKQVAEPLRDFVHGTISAEMLMDVAFTLAHNGGPIFNKGMLFSGFQSQSLIKILDVQRSGQIPQFIMDSNNTGHVLPQMTEYVRAFSKLNSDVLTNMDWSKVKNIKGQKVYTTEMNKQKMVESGEEKIASMKNEVAAAKQDAEAKKQVEECAQLLAEKEAADAEIKKNSVEITPNVYVAKAERSLT